MTTLDDILLWLRVEIIATKNDLKLLQEEAGTTGDVNCWDSTRMMLGQIQAYELTIRRIRGLTEREFQLEKKKGTL